MCFLGCYKRNQIQWIKSRKLIFFFFCFILSKDLFSKIVRTCLSARIHILTKQCERWRRWTTNKTKTKNTFALFILWIELFLCHGSSHVHFLSRIDFSVLWFLWARKWITVLNIHCVCVYHGKIELCKRKMYFRFILSLTSSVCYSMCTKIDFCCFYEIIFHFIDSQK